VQTEPRCWSGRWSDLPQQALGVEGVAYAVDQRAGRVAELGARFASLAQNVTPSLVQISSRMFGGSPITGPITGPNGATNRTSSVGMASRGGVRPAVVAAVASSPPRVPISPPRTYASPTRPESKASRMPSATSSRCTNVSPIDPNATGPARPFAALSISIPGTLWSPGP
jgi:hypothetical protein